ncbi:hypothetical protein ACH47V_26145 [Micromonospora chersina]|uniref:hypothetical protein n=1 Tax=Micromonospora chersina TaxID=47854 RepID=UPI0034061452
MELPGEVAGLAGLAELTAHSWDIDVSCGRPYAPADAALGAFVRCPSRTGPLPARRPSGGCWGYQPPSRSWIGQSGHGLSWQAG